MKYANQMFGGAELTGHTAEEVFHQGFKIFSHVATRAFGVGQGQLRLTGEQPQGCGGSVVGPYLKKEERPGWLRQCSYVTDVKTRPPDAVYYGEGRRGHQPSRAPSTISPSTASTLPGVVSRKLSHARHS